VCVCVIDVVRKLISINCMPYCSEVLDILDDMHIVQALAV
jgi:hypothetical protein